MEPQILRLKRMCIFQAFILGFSGAYIQLHPSFLLGCGLEGWDNRMHSPRIALICSIELFLLALLLIKVAFLYPFLQLGIKQFLQTYAAASPIHSMQLSRMGQSSKLGLCYFTYIQYIYIHIIIFMYYYVMYILYFK